MGFVNEGFKTGFCRQVCQVGWLFLRSRMPVASTRLHCCSPQQPRPAETTTPTRNRNLTTTTNTLHANSSAKNRTHGMNPLLFERSSGSLGPNGFARIQTASLLGSFAAALRFRFDGGERAVSGSGDEASRASLWAHQAGVSALALERFDGRM